MSKDKIKCVRFKFCHYCNSVDLEGKTALHYAAENLKPEWCTLLLKHGADVNARDDKGETPLMCASRSIGALKRSEWDCTVPKLLRERGADPLATNLDRLNAAQILFGEVWETVAQIL